MIANRPTPKLMHWHAVKFPKNVPQCQIDTANRGAPDNTVAMPEMLAKHHLPEVFDATRILADQKLADILHGANH